VSIKPDYAEAYYGIGWAYGELGEYAKAIEAYKKSITVDPYFARALAALGNVYVLTGDKDSALKQYERLYEVDSVRAENLLNAINAK
jgi:tetratricopeptide (TPR) repeat protein